MRLYHALILATGLAACTPLSIYHRTGASVAQMQQDTLACEVQALRDAPVANQIYRDPPEFIPPRRICDASGACTIRPGYWLPGDVYTVDVNLDLRRRVEASCMAARGYAPVSIPQCPQSVASAVPAARTQTLPPLSSQSCVIKNSDGSFQIVTRG
jgi:hypothetical protein